MEKGGLEASPTTGAQSDLARCTVWWLLEPLGTEGRPHGAHAGLLTTVAPLGLAELLLPGRPRCQAAAPTGPAPTEGSHGRGGGYACPQSGPRTATEVSRLLQKAETHLKVWPHSKHLKGLVPMWIVQGAVGRL